VHEVLFQLMLGLQIPGTTLVDIARKLSVFENVGGPLSGGITSSGRWMKALAVVMRPRQGEGHDGGPCRGPGWR
jgi:hypothetical protein